MIYFQDPVSVSFKRARDKAVAKQCTKKIVYLQNHLYTFKSNDVAIPALLLGVITIFIVAFFQHSKSS